MNKRRTGKRAVEAGGHEINLIPEGRAVPELVSGFFLKGRVKHQ